MRNAPRSSASAQVVVWLRQMVANATGALAASRIVPLSAPVPVVSCADTLPAATIPAKNVAYTTRRERTRLIVAEQCPVEERMQDDDRTVATASVRPTMLSTSPRFPLSRHATGEARHRGTHLRSA